MVPASAGAATSVRLELTPVLVGAVVAADDHMAMAAEAADVDLDAAPGGETAVVDAEFAVDVDRLAGMLLQQREERLREARVMSGVVAAPSTLAGTAEEGVGVVVRDVTAADSAKAGMCRRTVHGARVGRRCHGG